MSSGINLGLVFTAPGESEYNLVRRCLIANAGCSLAHIREVLKALRYNKGMTTVECLKTMQTLTPVRLVKKNVAIREQCPECAADIYHTDLFALPWITHCPIHRCKLTTICPQCNAPWPAEVELHYRDCPLCGVPGISPIIHERLHMRRQHSYQSIIELLAFCLQQHYHRATLVAGVVNKGVRTPWWREPTYMDRQFPLFAMQPTWPRHCALLETVGVKAYRMKSATVQLLSADSVLTPFATTNSSTLSHSDVLHSQRIAALSDVFEELLTWIRQSRHHPFEVYILDFRSWRGQHFLNGPCPCPYCMAISIWLFLSVSEQLRMFSMGNVHLYPFIRELGLEEFCQPSMPLTIMTSINRMESYYNQGFKPDDFSSIWFYKRGLKVLFNQVLLLCLHIYNQYHKNISDNGCECIERIDKVSPKVNSDFILSALRVNKIEAYYDDDPWDNYLEDICRPISVIQCQEFHRRHPQVRRVSQRFKYILVDSNTENQRVINNIVAYINAPS